MVPASYHILITSNVAKSSTIQSVYLKGKFPVKIV